MTRTAWLACTVEFGPLLLFFIAGQLTDFYTAVSLLVISTFLATAVSLILDSRMPWLPVISALFVILGGTLTLFYKQPDAIILADTFYYLSIALALTFGIIKDQLVLKFLFGTIFALSDDGWYRLMVRWCIFLLLAAAANEAARALLTPEQWIEYRFFKTIVVTAFAFYQLRVIRTFRLHSESNDWGIRTRRLES